MADRPAPLWGVAAEFASRAAFADAVASLRAQGFRRIDAFSPRPLPALSEQLGIRGWGVPAAGIAGAVLASAGFFALCCWNTLVTYALPIGGRPALSWPSFVIPSLSVGMLGGAVMATLAMVHLNRLPRLNHPVFNVDGFARVSRDRYFLTVEPVQDDFDPAAVERALAALPQPPLGVQYVPR